MLASIFAPAFSACTTTVALTGAGFAASATVVNALMHNAAMINICLDMGSPRSSAANERASVAHRARQRAANHCGVTPRTPGKRRHAPQQPGLARLATRGAQVLRPRADAAGLDLVVLVAEGFRERRFVPLLHRRQRQDLRGVAPRRSGD